MGSQPEGRVVRVMVGHARAEVVGFTGGRVVMDMVNDVEVEVVVGLGGGGGRRVGQVSVLSGSTMTEGSSPSAGKGVARARLLDI